MDYRTWPGLPNAVTREDAPLSKESWTQERLCQRRQSRASSWSLSAGPQELAS